MFKNAIVSVTIKEGLIEFLKPLSEKGLRIVSTGGTEKYLKEHGIPVVPIKEQTGFEEVMDGRVRTLHPYVHMPILARSNHQQDEALLNQFSLEPFDLVICNLYDFESASQNKNLNDESLVEHIDIGGPTLLRAAAKNYHRVTVLCDPKDYSQISNKLPNENLRKKLAAKVFSHVSYYDSQIASHLDSDFVNFDKCAIGLKKIKTLRYGENPQQKANWYQTSNHGLHNSRILQGKELSYNNILDLNSALSTVSLFDSPSCIAVKHNNPCGVATGDSLKSAVKKCIEADSKSIFGGIIALNREMDGESAELLSPIFLECIVAPKFSQQALEILNKKNNLRLLELSNFQRDSFHFTSVHGGVVLQTLDSVLNWSKGWIVIGESPSPEIKKDLSFSWKVCSMLKSNAIAICQNEQSIGLGMGQVNRVDSVKIAIERMRENHSIAKNCVLASDAFFPFEDSIDLIHQAKIEWIIQPGGSLRDEQVIKRAKELGINMVLTQTRHFKH